MPNQLFKTPYMDTIESDGDPEIEILMKNARENSYKAQFLAKRAENLTMHVLRLSSQIKSQMDMYTEAFGGPKPQQLPEATHAMDAEQKREESALLAVGEEAAKETEGDDADGANEGEVEDGENAVDGETPASAADGTDENAGEDAKADDEDANADDEDAKADDEGNGREDAHGEDADENHREAGANDKGDGELGVEKASLGGVEALPLAEILLCGAAAVTMQSVRGVVPGGGVEGYRKDDSDCGRRPLVADFL